MISALYAYCQSDCFMHLPHNSQLILDSSHLALILDFGKEDLP
jgi:hypothetical protein